MNDEQCVALMVGIATANAGLWNTDPSFAQIRIDEEIEIARRILRMAKYTVPETVE